MIKTVTIRTITTEEFDLILVENIKKTDPFTLIQVLDAFDALAGEFYKGVFEKRWDKESL